MLDADAGEAGAFLDESAVEFRGGAGFGKGEGEGSEGCIAVEDRD